jgi:hypothetical protein
MKIVVTFKGGPEWNPEDYSVPFHHIAHGVSEEFMKKSLEWIYKIPGLTGASTDKPKELNTGVNWFTTLHFAKVPDQLINGKPATEDVIAQFIIQEFKSVIIPELSKIGYDIDINSIND